MRESERECQQAVPYRRFGNLSAPCYDSSAPQGPESSRPSMSGINCRPMPSTSSPKTVAGWERSELEPTADGILDGFVQLGTSARSIRGRRGPMQSKRSDHMLKTQSQPRSTETFDSGRAGRLRRPSLRTGKSHYPVGDEYLRRVVAVTRRAEAAYLDLIRSGD